MSPLTLQLIFSTKELFSAHMMSLRAHITQGLPDNDLVNKASRSYGREIEKSSGVEKQLHQLNCGEKTQ